MARSGFIYCHIPYWTILIAFFVEVLAGSLTSVCDGIQRSTDAIVILGQKKHSSYDSTHSTSLHPVLQSLLTNYAPAKESDILIWHEGDLNVTDLPSMPGFSIRMCNLKESGAWGPPNNTRPLKAVDNWVGSFSAGYKYMIRFYAVTIWPLLDSLGYKWVMRFDDDSLLLSSVNYNMFDSLKQRGKQYGFRTYSAECGFKDTFAKFLDSFLTKRGIELAHIGGMTTNYCESAGEMGFYNNFFVANISWWLTNPNVTSFMSEFDNSNLIFTHRVSDLIFQSAAVRLFMSPMKRMRFIDFTYQHHTVLNGKVLWGGIEAGLSDENWRRTLKSYCHRFNVRGCKRFHFSQCILASNASCHADSRYLNGSFDFSEGGCVLNYVQSGYSPYCSPFF